MIAKKIVSSSLVKTAAFGGDGNWDVLFARLAIQVAGLRQIT